MTQWHDGPGALEIEAMEQVALFRSMDSCFAALAARTHDTLTEREAKRVIAAYGLPVVDEVLSGSAQEAPTLLHRLRVTRLLQGFLGAAPTDLRAVVAIVARLSECVADHAAIIREIDVNPLVCAGGRIVAVDALIACAPGNAA